tara:strand:- start:1208 stop:1612 length:405 start_codon:yes stop_codon:yes gene_type:complete
MSFNISIIINLKKSNMSNIEDIIKESSINCNVKSIYYDYDIEGINNYIKKNNKIIILEFDNEENFINFLKFIINIKELTIEYIYYENSILYCSNKYLNNISETLHNKKKILNTIEENKKSNNYKKIYNILNKYN